MNDDVKLRGWKLFICALFLGPFFLVLYFEETRRSYPSARYFAWISIFIMAVSTYLLFTFSFSPSIVRIVYCVFFLCIFGLAFLYCWVLDAKTKERKPRPGSRYSFSRAVAWLIVMGILFQGLNNIVQAIYYWIFGEQVAVYFSAETNIFMFWVAVGFLYGFLYGVQRKNGYFNRDLRSVMKSIFLVFLFIFMFNGLVLLLVIYPLQRLAPVSYSPQLADYLFYFLLFIAISLSSIYLIRAAHRHGFLKMSGMLIAGIPLIALHAIAVSTYSTTINLTVASIFEDKGELSSAKELYAKSIPYIRYDHLLASLHHRQGVLHVLNQDYISALASFKRVLADYSEGYGVYENARKYVESYEKNEPHEKLDRTVLPVRHRTFEQAASCFPNSLSVILNFYEEQPISTRKLSYAIKESFSSGTFIWKAESFLSQNGYTLITAFWQDKKMLLSLIDAGYPVLVYVPGHVYTLYGYDANMEMFFTYDTAKSNRWNDKPFYSFQKDWMSGNFLMSVVVEKGEEEKFESRFPQITRYSQPYSLWQKVQISNYYNQKDNYWTDYNYYSISESLGLDRLIAANHYFLSEDFYPLPWDQEKWNQEILPVLNQHWATDWYRTEKFFLYLIYNGQSEQALDLIRQYESRMSEEARFSFPRLLELKLAAALSAGKEQEVLSISDKLIGITDNGESDSYWGHYVKAKRMIASDNSKAAVEILFPALKTIYLRRHPRTLSSKYILDAMNEIYQIDPSLIDTEKESFLEVARIYLATGSKTQ